MRGEAGTLVPEFFRTINVGRWSDASASRIPGVIQFCISFVRMWSTSEHFPFLILVGLSVRNWLNSIKSSPKQPSYMDVTNIDLCKITVTP